MYLAVNALASRINHVNVLYIVLDLSLYPIGGQRVSDVSYWWKNL